MECALASALERCDEGLALRLRNTSHAHPLAWKVKTNHRLRYLFRPTQGVILCGEDTTCDVFEDNVHPATPKDKLLVLSTSVDSMIEHDDLTSLWREKQRLHDPTSGRSMFSETKLRCPPPPPVRAAAVSEQSDALESTTTPVSAAQKVMDHLIVPGGVAQHNAVKSTPQEKTTPGTGSCRSTSFVSLAELNGASTRLCSDDTDSGDDEREVFSSPQKVTARDPASSTLLTAKPHAKRLENHDNDRANNALLDVDELVKVSRAAASDQQSLDNSGRERAATVSIPLKVPTTTAAPSIIMLGKPRSVSSPLPNAHFIDTKRPQRNASASRSGTTSQLSPTGRWSSSSRNLDFQRNSSKSDQRRRSGDISPIGRVHNDNDSDCQETEEQRKIRERISKVLESHDGKRVYDDDDEENEEENLNDALYGTGTGAHKKPSKHWTSDPRCRLSLDSITNQQIPAASGDEQYRKLLEYVTKLSRENQQYKVALAQQERRSRELQAEIDGFQGQAASTQASDDDVSEDDEDPWLFSRRIGKETAERAQSAITRFSTIFSETADDWIHPSQNHRRDSEAPPIARANNRSDRPAHAISRDFLITALMLALCVCLLAFLCGGSLRVVM